MDSQWQITEPSEHVYKDCSNRTFDVYVYFLLINNK